MRFRSYLRTLAVIVAALVALKVGLSVVIDPYQAFGTFGIIERNFEPNTRISKVRFLSERCRDFDSYVLGTSRVNYYNVEDASEIFGGRFYNFNVSAETMGGVRAKLRWLAANCPVERVVVGLDFDWFHSAEFHQGDLLRREHPAAIGGGFKPFRYAATFAPYLNVPTRTLRRSVRARFEGPLRFRLDLETGHVLLFEDGRIINQSEDSTVAVTPIAAACYAPARLDAEHYRSSKSILADIVRFLRKSSIEAVFVINPINQNVAARFDPQQYAAFVRDAATITGGVWYFGGFNELTESDERYVDASHFGRPTGAEVLRIIAGQSEPLPPLGFFDAGAADRLHGLALADYRARELRCGPSS